jgi:DNA-binding MarR family transcriptional regulator
VPPVDLIPTQTAQREREALRALARLTRLLESTAGGREPDGLSLAHYRVLSAVASGDERASRMAARMALGKPAVSAAVEALCQRGLLSRAGVEGDQRATALRITAEGEAVLDAAEAAMLRRLRSVWDRTPDRERVIDSLRWLASALDEIGEQRIADLTQQARR